MRNKTRAALYGVAVADALGATLEFMDKAQIQRKYGQLRDIIGGGWLNLTPGEWTDDTEMTLAVAEGILANPWEPVEHVGERFLEWTKTNPPDIGNSIRAVFNKYPRYNNWFKAAEAVHNEGMRTAGNGALMRTIPIALLYKDPADIYMMSMQIARMTHWDPEAGLTCFLYCLLVRAFLDGERDKLTAWKNAKEVFSQIVPAQFSAVGQELINHKLSAIESWSDNNLIPSGYTVDTLACALWSFFNRDSFEECVVFAVNLGGDADTVGAVAGGLAGAYWGFESIPAQWIGKLKPEQVAKLDRLALGLGKVVVK